MLLTDGSVIGTAQPGGVWKLAPSATGTYDASTWTALTSMHNGRLYYGSNVLPDGRLFVVGGEYDTGHGFGEVYDPIANTWTTPFNANGTSDTETALLPDGTVYIAWISQIYTPSTGLLSAGPTFPNGGYDEAGFVLLPDQSFLTIPINDTHAYRLVPSQNNFVAAGTTPASLYDSGSEIGPAVRLADGTVFWVGASGKTARYTPGATSADPGSWAAGPDIPSMLHADDAPAAVLPNGHVLFVADKGSYTGPAAVFEYDPSGAGSITLSAGSPAPSVAYTCRMLVLPTGQVILSTGSAGYLYTPNVTPDPTWKPTIAMLVLKSAGVYELSGTQLHGFSEGAAYGDDAEMSTNFPLVRFEAGGNVTYARTFGWAPAVIGLGTTKQTTQFKLPTLTDGNYNLVVVANGIASDPLAVKISGGTLVLNDFTIGQPAAVTVQQGGMATTTIATTKVSGMAETVALTATALPTGVTASFNPASVTSDNGMSTITVNAALTTALGMAKFTVKAAGSTVMRTQDVTINVVPPPDMAIGPDMTVPPDLSPPGTGGTGGTGGGGSGGGGSGGSGGGNGNHGGSGGCSCDVSGRSDGGTGAAAGLMLLALAIYRRRARRSEQTIH
jgi:MYXO-CTERM domain-containing protein